MRIRAHVLAAAVGTVLIVTSVAGCDVSVAPAPGGSTASPGPSSPPVYPLVAGITSLSHEYPGWAGLAVKHAVVHLGQEAARELLSPEPLPEHDEVEAPQPFQHVHAGLATRPKDLPEHLPLMPVLNPPPSPVLALGFDAINDNETWIPPDTDGAVGPSHIVDVINERIRVQDRLGSTLTTLTFAGFWAASGYTDVYDPHVFYDPYGQRWIFVAASDPGLATAGVVLATSQTTDPNGKWDLYAVRVDPTGKLWGDFPTFGFNKNWITVGVNLYPVAAGNFGGVNVYAFDKADLYGGGTGKHTVFNLPNEFTMTGAVTFDPNLDDEYVVEDWDGTMGQIANWTISGPVGSEKINGPALVTGPDKWNDYVAQDFGPQLGAARDINLGDSRTFEVTYRNGKLWTSQIVFLPEQNPTHTAAQWWQFAPDGTLAQFGRIEDPNGVDCYAYPSLSVNAHDDVLFGYAHLSPQAYASADYSFRAGVDAPNTMRSDTLLQAGVASYVKTYGGSRNRWGDYSNTVVDPNDDLTLWTIGEYVSAQDTWATWWGELTSECAGELDGVPCNDGNPCTVSDACSNGKCAGAPKSCPGKDACNVGACDPTGACIVRPAIDGTACTDGNPCTTPDVCVAGACTAGPPIVCADVDACNAGTCNMASGKCVAAPKTNGTKCDDGNACTTGDVCTAGKCAGAGGPACPPPGECQTGAGTCDAKSGACDYTSAPDGTPCSIGTCVAGTCTKAPPPASSNGAGPDVTQGGGCACTTAPGSGGGGEAPFAWLAIGAVAAAGLRARGGARRSGRRGKLR
jgi:hypothetical protein